MHSRITLLSVTTAKICRNQTVLLGMTYIVPPKKKLPANSSPHWNKERKDVWVCLIESGLRVCQPWKCQCGKNAMKTGRSIICRRTWQCNNGSTAPRNHFYIFRRCDVHATTKIRPCILLWSIWHSSKKQTSIQNVVSKHVLKKN